MKQALSGIFRTIIFDSDMSGNMDKAGNNNPVIRVEDETIWEGSWENKELGYGNSDRSPETFNVT